MHDVTDNPALQVGESVMDILRFIKEAHDSDAIDEALWRVFLAAHFGRPSASTLDEVNSAGRFLCTFGQRPTWTWTYVTANSSAFIDQLYAHEVELRTLRFGNHRKYYSQQPDALEIEMRIFQRGCLSRRVESLPARLLRIAALEADRTAHHRTIAWQFTCPDAREKPSHLSPLAQLWNLPDHS